MKLEQKKHSSIQAGIISCFDIHLETGSSFFAVYVAKSFRDLLLGSQKKVDYEACRMMQMLKDQLQ